MIAHRTPLSPRTKGGFGRVILAIRRLNRGEEVMSDGMMSESGINGALEKFGKKLRLDIGRNKFKSIGLRLDFLRNGRTMADFWLAGNLFCRMEALHIEEMIGAM